MSIPLVILAGGKGTRLGLHDKPKPLAKICGKTILELQLEIAQRYSIKECYILLGYLGDSIKNEIGYGEKWNLDIKYIQEDHPLGTAGAVKQLENIIKGDFIVFYGDTLLDIDLFKFIQFHKEKMGVASLFTHPNSHPFDSDIIETDEDDRVTQIHSKPHDKKLNNLVNAALYILNSEIFRFIRNGVEQDFGKDIFRLVLKANYSIFSYKSTEYIKDIGTKKRIKEAEDDLLKGIVRSRNYSLKQKAIFLDRDGVINEEVGDLTSIEQFRLYPNTIEAIKLINKSGYLCIVVTNQPCIAKGFCSKTDLQEIHNYMEWLLGEEGVYVDDIYFCPHHPETGFENEIQELKINCNCRKPNPGMLIKAVNKHNLDESKSYIIGDRTIDLEAGKRVGINGVFVKTGFGGLDKKYKVTSQYSAIDLLDAVKYIINDNQ